MSTVGNITDGAIKNICRSSQKSSNNMKSSFIVVERNGSLF